MTNELSHHIPVMLEEVLQFLRPRPGGRYIDGTVGGGGHTAALLEQSAPDGQVLAIDTDQQALARVRARLGRYVEDGRLILKYGNFGQIEDIAHKVGLSAVDGVILDLGFSSDQMDNPQRGFSFSVDGPLDMRLDQTRPVTAAELVNTLSAQELADIFWRYGEETRSRQIARRIVQERERVEITRTAQLASLIAAGVPYQSGAIHPATRAFQALRIVVNGELEQLETALPQIVPLLNTAVPGRVAIIAFHSLEDRIVKDFFRREASDCICPPRLPICQCGHQASLRIVTKKPVVPTSMEVERNPRARSAKLRVAEARMRQVEKIAERDQR